MGCKSEPTSDLSGQEDIESKKEDEKLEYDSLTQDLLKSSAIVSDPLNLSQKKEEKQRTVQSEALNKQHACDFPGCDAKFSRPWKLSAHRCQHTGDRPFVCSRAGCYKGYTNPAHLRRHDVKAHGEKEDNEKEKPKELYKCKHPNCTMTGHRGFQTIDSLKRHEKKHYSISEIEKNFQHKCTNCERAFRKSNELKTHQFHHDGILPFKCESCDLGFLHEYDFKRHLRGHKTYTCPVSDCAELFQSWNKLRKHTATQHNNFTCSLCNKAFTMKCRLRTHIETQHRDSPPDAVWHCNVDGCNRSFTLKRNMVQHIRHRHLGTGYTCPYKECSQRLIWKTSFEKHLRLHEIKGPVEIRKSRPPKSVFPDFPRSAAELLSDVIADRKTEAHLVRKEEVDTDEERMRGIVMNCENESDRSFNEEDDYDEEGDEKKANDMNSGSDKTINIENKPAEDGNSNLEDNSIEDVLFTS